MWKGEHSFRRLRKAAMKIIHSTVYYTPDREFHSYNFQLWKGITAIIKKAVSHAIYDQDSEMSAIHKVKS